jgi:DNA primase
MNNNSFYSNEIKRRVTMHDVVARYGLKVGRGNRIPCPFHNGKDNNLSYKADFFKCFVCDESGDVIAFVQKYHGLSFAETLLRIDDDFSLGLGVGKRTSDREKLRLAQRSYEVRRERASAQKVQQAKEKAYHDAYDEYARLDRQMIDYRPRSEDEKPSSEFIEALQQIETARYMLDCADEEVYNYEQERNNRGA